MIKKHFLKIFRMAGLALALGFTFPQCKSGKNLKYTGLNNRIINSSISDDPAVDSLISPYKAELDKQMNVVLNFADEDLEKGKPEGKLGNLVADLSMVIAPLYYSPEDGKNIDFCLLNNGGLRTIIPKGPITLGLAYQVMPFENELVVVTLSGEKTHQLFEYLAAKGGEPVSGVKLGIIDKKPAEININGQPFDQERDYKVLTSDYLARGGDKMDFFLDPVNYEPVGIKLRDAIIIYLEKMKLLNKTIDARLEGRIYYIDE